MSGELVPLADGRHLEVWSGGDPAGHLLLFLPGCPDSRLVALPGDGAARRLGLRLVSVNRPGYGRSDPHDSDHLSVADDLVAVADAVGASRFSVLGMSLGGGYALATAARHPTRVRSVGVVAAPGPLPAMDPPWHRDDLDDAQRGFLRRLAATDVTGAVTLMRPDFARFVEQVRPSDPDDAALVARFLALLPPTDAAILAARPVAEVARQTREALTCPGGYLRDAAVTFRHWRFDLGAVRCPVSLWYGGLDANAPERHGRWLAERLPDATLRVFPTATHLGTLHAHWEDVLSALRPGA